MADNTSKWGKATAAKRYAEGGGIPEPSPRVISGYEALNSKEGWESHPDGAKVPAGYEGARGRNSKDGSWGGTDGSDHGRQYMRPAKESVPMSNRGGKVK